MRFFIGDAVGRDEIVITCKNILFVYPCILWQANSLQVKLLVWPAEPMPVLFRCQTRAAQPCHITAGLVLASSYYYFPPLLC